MLFHIAETITIRPAETNQKPKPVVTKTAVSALETQTKTGIDKETFFFHKQKFEHCCDESTCKYFDVTNALNGNPN